MMIDLFFTKRFILESIIPYVTLFMSVGYIIFETAFPKEKKEKFYIYSDKLFFKFVIRPIEQFKKTIKYLKLNISTSIKKRKLKRAEKKKAKEVAKKQRQQKATERSKAKKIDRVNKKATKYQKKVDKNKNKNKNKNKKAKNNKNTSQTINKNLKNKKQPLNKNKNKK